MARLRTPHCTTAVRLTGRAHDLVEAAGDRSPHGVGWRRQTSRFRPRATGGTPKRGRPWHRPHLGFGLRQCYHQRTLAVRGQAVTSYGVTSSGATAKHLPAVLAQGCQHLACRSARVAGSIVSAGWVTAVGAN